MSIRLRRGGAVRRIRLGIVVTISTVAACAPAPRSAMHTVEEYRADDALRTAVLAQCANDPGTLGNAPDCVNVRQAEALESIGSQRELPALGLPVPGDSEPMN